MSAFSCFPRLELLEIMNIYQLRDYGLILCFLFNVFISLLMNIMQMLFLPALLFEARRQSDLKDDNVNAIITIKETVSNFSNRKNILDFFTKTANSNSSHYMGQKELNEEVPSISCQMYLFLFLVGQSSKDITQNMFIQ